MKNVASYFLEVEDVSLCVYLCDALVKHAKSHDQNVFLGMSSVYTAQKQLLSLTGHVQKQKCIVGYAVLD